MECNDEKLENSNGDKANDSINKNDSKCESVLQLDTLDSFDIYIDKSNTCPNDDNSKSTVNEIAQSGKNISEQESESVDAAQENCDELIDMKDASTAKPNDQKRNNDKSNKNGANDTKMKMKKEKSNTHALWVYNILKTTKATDLKSHLSKFGKIVSAKIVTDGENCYGYVLLNDQEDVKQLIANLDNTHFEGKKITLSLRNPVKESRNRKKTPPRRSLTRKVEGKHQRHSRELSKPKRLTHKHAVRRSPLRRSRSERPRIIVETRRSNVRNSSRENSKLRKSSTVRTKERSRERSVKRKRSYDDWKEDERRKEIEMKLNDARKKLQKEKELFQKEKLELLRLQKVIADYERMDVKRQTDIIKKEARELEANLLKCKNDELEKKMNEINRKYYTGSPPKKITRYEDKKLHITPPPPPNICKENSNEHKLSKKRYEDDKIMNDSRPYQRYQYNKEHIHHNVFNKYHQPNNKKPTEMARCNDPSSVTKNVTWKQISSSAHHINEDYQSEYWKEPIQNTNQRYRPVVTNSTNFSSSFYHYPEYPRYGYHQADNGRKY